MAGVGPGAAVLVPTCWNEKDKSPLLEVTQGLQVYSFRWIVPPQNVSVHEPLAVLFFENRGVRSCVLAQATTRSARLGNESVP